MPHRRIPAQRLVQLACTLGILTATSALSQIGPPVTPGFPNVSQTPGAILSGLNAPGQGRTAVLAYHNGVLFTVPEIPSSQPGADFQVRTWDISDPTQPVELAQWGTTPHPISAHGYFKSGQYLVIGSNWPPQSPWSFVPGAQPHTVQRTSFPELTCAGARGCLFGPWYINQTFWSYDETSGNAEIQLDWNLLSSWDHLGLTGVIGHPFLLGDLLIFASDQSRTGVATYDVSDPTNPVLLDVLTTGGPGGYWPEIWGHDGSLYIVFPYRTGGNGFRVVDATDPANLRFVTDRSLPGDDAMYIQFQDEYAFMGGHKVDMRTFESVLFLDGANTPRPNQPGQVGIDTSQHLLPIGNLLVTGGIGPNEGMAIWAHQAEPDTRGPSVGFHIPQAGRTNYPTGAPISLMIHETLETFTIVDGETIIVRPVGGAPISGRITFSFEDVLTYMPDDALAPDTSYEVVIPAGGIKDAAGNGIAGYSFTFSTGATLGGNTPPTVDSFTVSQYPVAPGASVTLSATASDPDDDPIEYRFDFGDGSAKTAWSSSAAVATSYSEAGHYRAAVQVRDAVGSIASETRTVTVAIAPNGPPPTNSAPIVCEQAARRVWVANPDNDSIAAIDADSLLVQLERPVCDDPRSIAVSSGDEVWVACHDDDTVRVLDANGVELASIDTGHGSAPLGLAISPDGNTAFATLHGSGSLLRFDTQTRQQTGNLDLGPTPGALAISGDGSTVLVTRFLSPRNHAEVWEADAAAMTLNRTIVIPKFGGDENFDSTAAGRGVANYLAGITIAPDGSSAWVSSNKANSERGVLFGPDLDQDNSVRNIITQIDLGSGTFRRAIDIDNSDSARAVAFSPLGDYLTVALQGNNETVVFDALALEGSNGLGSLVARLGAGSAPQGICVDAATGRTFVKNLMSRDVTVQETAGLFEVGNVSIASSEVATVSAEQMSSDVRLGKEVFYNAGDPRMSAEGYLSCATCHVDGGHDGRVWDFTGRGEGLRNTTTLRGRAGTGHGNVHWSANFDEIQDFENDIRNAFGGSGFLTDPDFALTSDTLGPAKAGRSPELDALAAYVSSLDAGTAPRSPWRNPDGSMTSAAVAGQSHFSALGCADCHSGASLTDSTLGTATLHDVGTLRTTSGQRLAGPLLGIDTPSLLGVWAGAPYFHDGSATTLEDVFQIAGGTVLPAESSAVTSPASVTTQWVEYNNDDTVHGRALVDFGGAGSAFTFFNVDGGSGGIGAIEARYSAGYGVFPVVFTVNGTTYSTNAPLLGNEPQWRHTNWGTLRVEGVAFTPGSTNTIRISSSTEWANLSFDEIVVSNPDDLAAAQPHRAVLGLTSGQRSELIAYLLQIEGAAPPSGVHSISGQVLHAGSGAGISGAAISLTGGVPDSITVGANGSFTFAQLSESAWGISARRTDPTLTGVSALDAAWALQNAIGSRTLTPLQAMACDVTANGAVSALDASYILQRLLGTLPAFPAAGACGSDWMLMSVPGSPGAVPPTIDGGNCDLGGYSYDPLDTSIDNAHFDGTAFGDCTLNGGSAVAATFGATAAPTVTVGTDRRRRGRYFRLPVSIEGVDELSALDLTLRYDPERLLLRRVRKAPSGAAALVRSATTSPGVTRVILASSRALSTGGRPVLYAVFERLAPRAHRVAIERAHVDDTAASVGAMRRRARR